MRPFIAYLLGARCIPQRLCLTGWKQCFKNYSRSVQHVNLLSARVKIQLNLAGLDGISEFQFTFDRSILHHHGLDGAHNVVPDSHIVTACRDILDFY